MFKKIFSVLFFLLLILYSDTAKYGALKGLNLCFSIAIPTLFPFFVASSLLSQTGVITSIGNKIGFIINKLYGLPKNCCGVLLLGLVGGYPVGISATCELYKNGEITKKQAEHLIGFCNNTGPAFIIGVCGVGIFKNIKIGVLLYLIHIISAFITGKFFCLKSDKQQKIKSKKHIDFSSALVSSCESAAQTSIKVVSFLTFFSVICYILNDLNVIFIIKSFISPVFDFLNIPVEIIYPVFYGFIELTFGLNEISNYQNFSYAVLIPTLSFMLAFGGLSVIFQSISILKSFNLCTKNCIIGKFIHSIISFIISLLIIPFLPKAVFVMSTGLFMPSLSKPYTFIFIFFILYILTTGKHSKNKL